MIGVFRLGASDRFRRLDEIDRFGMSHHKEGERERYFAKMRDGETVDMLEHDRDALLRRPLQLLPAEPGWSIIRVNDRGDETWTMREPVIGWAICFDGEIRPCAAAQHGWDSLPTIIYPASAFPVTKAESWCGEYEGHGYGESPC